MLAFHLETLARSLAGGKGHRRKGIEVLLAEMRMYPNSVDVQRSVATALPNLTHVSTDAAMQ